MNILHVNYSDILGERFNGYYMLNYSDDFFSIKMAVWKKDSNNDNVFEIPPHNKILKYILEKFLHLATRLGLDHIISIFGLYLLRKQSYYKEADLIHLHIIHGDSNLNFNSIYKICKRKSVVWTFHDQWAVTGGCIHPFECEGVKNGCPKHCPHPRYNSLFRHIFPYYIWKIKKYYYHRSDFNVVISTQWMMDRIKESQLISNKKISIIPFGVDLDKFKSKEKKSSRLKLGIPFDDFVIMFRNTGIDNDKFKALKYIKDALQNLLTTRTISIIILEKKTGFENLSTKYNLIHTGYTNPEQLIDCFSASDVFLMPSLQESFGLMAIEAMSCSLPVIVAEGTALPEVIGMNIGGLVIKQRNSYELQQSILFLINNPSNLSQLRKSARKRAEDLYSIEKCINSHKNLYQKIINS